MQRMGGTWLGLSVLLLLLGLLTPVAAVSASVAPSAEERAGARKGTVVMTIRTPAGVPGVVTLSSKGKERLLTKNPAGTAVRVKVTLPVGRWTVAPQQVVDDSAVFTGSSSAKQVRVRAGTTAKVTVTYRPAPSVKNVRIGRIDRTGLDLTWESPASDAEYAVRMNGGAVPPATATEGTGVPVDGTTATAADLAAATTYAFSVFAREPGTTRWWGPVSTTVTTPAADPGGESAVAVTNPATVLVTDPTDVSAAVVDGKVTSTVPAGTLPVPGQPWVLPRSSALPGGFVGTVSAVAPDGRSVSLEAGGLADAYDYLDIRVPDLTAAPTQVLPSRAARGGLDGRQRALAGCGGSGTQGIVVDPSFDPFGHFNATLTKYEILGKKIPVGMSFDGRFGVDVTVSADVSVEASAVCKADLPSFLQTVPAGSVPLMIIIKPRAELSASGKVTIRNAGFTVSLGADLDGYVGLGGDDELDADLIASAEPLQPEFEDVQVSLGVIAGVETSVGPGLGNKKAGATVGLNTQLNALDASLAPGNGPGCLEISAQHSASISIEAKAWLGKWDISRSITVPGLEASNHYPGSPWRLPSGCGGAGEYRILEGTLDVSHTWSGGCSNDQGACDDGPDYTSSSTFNESSSAHLRVAEPGPWGAQWDEHPAYLTAPMTFTSWDYDARNTWRSSGYGCSWSDTWKTDGPMQFGGAYWETAATAVPGPDLALDARLGHYYYGDWSEEWSQSWWGSLGAWDTDYSNGFPKINTTYSWVYGGDCEGSYNYDAEHTMEYLGPGHWYWPEEARRSSSQASSTPLGECTPEVCQWRVDGTDTYEYRSTYDNWGYQGSGSATVTWSYVIERRPPDPEPDPTTRS